MKTSRFLLLVASFFLAANGGLALAEGGWKMPNLNPFKKTDSHPAHLSQSDDSQSDGWHFPSIMKSQPKAKSSGPSMWNKVTTTSKNAWSATADFLNPFDDPKPEPQRDVTGSNTYFTQSSTKKQATKKPFWSWSSNDETREEESKQRSIRTVSDFIGGERPE